MKRSVKNLIIGFLCSIFLFSGMVLTCEAKKCNHKLVDVCKKCGYIRVHDFKESIVFYTIKDNVPVWSKPTKKSEMLREISDKDTMIEMNGLLRNEYGNIWLKVDGDGYVYIENLYLNFYSLILRSWQKISAFEGETALATFYNEVCPKGPADYKVWLDPSSKGIEYNVLMGEECYRITAEELGNVNYGYLGSMMGFSEDVLLYAGGAVNLIGIEKKKTWSSAYEEALRECYICDSFLCEQIERMCAVRKTPTMVMTNIISKCSKSYCDSEEDSENVKKGIDFFNNGKYE